MCGKFQVIPTLKSFRKRILRRKAERDASKIINNYLTVDGVKKKESKLFLLTQENQRLKGRRHFLKVKLAEYSKRGSIKANHLDHQSRSMRMGKYLVHLNHVREVYEKYQFTEHGLLSTDIEMKNRIGGLRKG